MACYCGLVRGQHVQKIGVSGTPNCLNYRDIFIVYTQFTNVAADHMRPVGRAFKTHGLNVYVILL